MSWFRRRQRQLPPVCPECGQTYRAVFANPNDCYRFYPCEHAVDFVKLGIRP